VSTYLNRNSLVGCLFAVGLLGGLPPMVLAQENGSDHSTNVPATATDKPANDGERFEARSRGNGRIAR